MQYTKQINYRDPRYINQKFMTRVKLTFSHFDGAFAVLQNHGYGTVTCHYDNTEADKLEG